MTAIQFWKWFSENNSKYFFLNQIENKSIREDFLNDFQEKLHSFCNKIYFEVGGLPDAVQEIIITAEGDKNYFHKVTELVNAAPPMENWKVIAFKPATGFDFILNYEGTDIDPKKLWFLPLSNKSKPDLIGVKIASEQYPSSFNNDSFLSATLIILDNILGEKSNTEDIAFLKTCDLPVNPKNSGFMSLVDLPDYIKWKKKRI